MKDSCDERLVLDELPDPDLLEKTTSAGRQPVVTDQGAADQRMRIADEVRDDLVCDLVCKDTGRYWL